MSGTPATMFADFVESTGPLYITTPDGVINDAQRNNTYSFGAIMGGDRGKKKMISGGSEIRFSTTFETGARTRFHQPGATQNWAQPQKLVHGRAAWRFLITDMTWNLQTVELNEGTGSEEEMFQQFVDLKRSIEQRMWTDKWDFMEEHIWSEPDFTEMESLAGGELGTWYSIPAFVNNQTNGLFNNSGTAGTRWTTVHGIDPATTVKGQNRFAPQTTVYSNMGTNASTDPNLAMRSILGAFEKMWKKVHFEKPPTMGEYFSNPAYNNQQIFTSPEGQSAYTSFLRTHQDLFVIEGRQDPAYPDPQFNFIPVKYVDFLTTAPLYQNNTTAASTTDNVSEGNSATITGPRYYWINSNYLYPCFHKTYFFLRGKVREHFNDPDTFVVPVRTWGNLKCTSRRRQGIVSPSVDLYASLYT
jgi:hypothetical protein